MSISVLNTDAGLSGKTLVDAESTQTLTGQKTFDRDPNPPFVVSSGSAVVPNLDADKVDGYDLPAVDGSSGQVLTTNGAGVLSWGAANTKPFNSWTALGNQPPLTAFAGFRVRGTTTHPVLTFDGNTDEEAVFGGVLNTGYAGGGLTVELKVGFTSATSGTSRWQAAIERIDATLDIDADSFAAFQSASFTAPGTSGFFDTVTITFTSGAQMDSLAAGEAFRLKIRRDADGTSGTDDITTDAELLRVVLRET